MKNIIKDACILFAITLVAGILLGLVYNVTNPASGGGVYKRTFSPPP